MKAFGLIFAALVFVVVNGRRCEHGDVSMCTGLNCTIAGETVGCEHDVCTCVTAPKPCLVMSDCGDTFCEKHDEHAHCVDTSCQCLKNDHHH